MKELLKQNYDESKMLIKNGEFKEVKHKYGEGYNIREESVSIYEYTNTVEEKLEIINSWTDGLGSYLLDLIDKWAEDRQNPELLKKTTWGSFNQLSVKKWIRNNDPRNVLRIWYNESYPTYYLYHEKYRMTRETPSTDYGYKMLYDGQDVINQWFHGLMKELQKMEEEYFINTDERHVKIKEALGIKQEIDSYLWRVTENINNKDLNEVNNIIKELKEIEDKLCIKE